MDATIVVTSLKRDSIPIDNSPGLTLQQLEQCTECKDTTCKSAIEALMLLTLFPSIAI